MENKWHGVGSFCETATKRDKGCIHCRLAKICPVSQ
jgi:hypothetical protein